MATRLFMAAAMAAVMSATPASAIHEEPDTAAAESNQAALSLNERRLIEEMINRQFRYRGVNPSSGHMIIQFSVTRKGKLILPITVLSGDVLSRTERVGIYKATTGAIMKAAKQGLFLRLLGTPYDRWATLIVRATPNGIELL